MFRTSGTFQGFSKGFKGVPWVFQRDSEGKGAPGCFKGFRGFSRGFRGCQEHSRGVSGTFLRYSGGPKAPQIVSVTFHGVSWGPSSVPKVYCGISRAFHKASGEFHGI